MEKKDHATGPVDGTGIITVTITFTMLHARSPSKIKIVKSLLYSSIICWAPSATSSAKLCTWVAQAGTAMSLLSALADLLRVSTGARTSSSLSYLLAGVHSLSSAVLSRVSKMLLRAVSSIWMALSTGFSRLCCITRFSALNDVLLTRARIILWMKWMRNFRCWPSTASG
jgi:hypothetical protein